MSGRLQDCFADLEYLSALFLPLGWTKYCQEYLQFTYFCMGVLTINKENDLKNMHMAAFLYQKYSPLRGSVFRHLTDRKEGIRSPEVLLEVEIHYI